MAYWSDASYQNDFDPIPALNRSDGDGTLFFLSSNALQFPQPCDDPVFAAHKPDPGVSFSNETFFLADNPAGVFGCLEQVISSQQRLVIKTNGYSIKYATLRSLAALLSVAP